MDRPIIEVLATLAQKPIDKKYSDKRAKPKGAAFCCPLSDNSI